MHKYTLMICKPGDGPYAQLEQEFENPLHEGDMIELYYLEGGKYESGNEEDADAFQVRNLWHQAGERKGTMAFCDIEYAGEEHWQRIIEAAHEYGKKQQKTKEDRKTTGKDRFEDDLKELIKAECLRRRTGKAYVLRHVDSVVRQMRTSQKQQTKED